MDTKLNHFKVFLKGVFIGFTDMIPGISGSTIALIFGVYNRFLSSLKNINLKNLKLIFKGNFKGFLKESDFVFLFFLLMGITFSLLVFSKIVNIILDFPILRSMLFSFFLGLIVASILFLLKDMEYNVKTVSFLILGFVVSLVIFFFSKNQASISLNFYLKLFVAGFFAIFAMLLPGISGSLVLLIFGVYPYVIHAVATITNPQSLYVVGFMYSGVFLGAILFPRLILWGIEKYTNKILSFLIGLMIGSIFSLWPFWQYKEQVYLNRVFLIPTTLKWPQLYELLLSIVVVLFGFYVFYKIKQKSIQNTKN